MEQGLVTGPGSGPAAGSIDDLIATSAAKYNIDPRVFRALLMQESSLNPAAAGPGGEQGIAQFTPATAAAFGIDPRDPAQAIPAAALYLRQNLNRFGGNMDQALAAYNWGPGNVATKGMGQAPASVLNYVRKIQGMPGVPAPGSGGGGSGVGGQGTGPLSGVVTQSPATAATPLASAQPPQSSVNPAMLASLLSGGAGGGSSLGTLIANAGQQFQQQSAQRAFGLA